MERRIHLKLIHIFIEEGKTHIMHFNKKSSSDVVTGVTKIRMDYFLHLVYRNGLLKKTSHPLLSVPQTPKGSLDTITSFYTKNTIYKYIC